MKDLEYVKSIKKIISKAKLEDDTNFLFWDYLEKTLFMTSSKMLKKVKIEKKTTEKKVVKPKKAIAKTKVVDEKNIQQTVIEPKIVKPVVEPINEIKTEPVLKNEPIKEQAIQEQPKPVTEKKVEKNSFDDFFNSFIAGGENKTIQDDDDTEVIEYFLDK